MEARQGLRGVSMSDTTVRSAPEADGFLDRYFGLTRNGTTVRTEAIAGVTTFLTMAYIVFVNPQNLKLALSAGVGLFLGLTALQTAGVVPDHPAPRVTMGALKKPSAILA